MGHGWESRGRQWLIFGIISATFVVGAILLLGSRGAADSINSFEACREAGYPVSDTNPPLCRASGHAFLGPLQPESTPVTPRAFAEFDILVDGDTHADLPVQGQTIINTQSDWSDYWRTVHAGLPTLPPIIPVDFTQFSVIGVNLGVRSTTGYGLKISTISTSDAGSSVELTETTPTVTCSVKNSPTNRYLIVRTEKLPEPVNFQVTRSNHRCP